ncbi:MAG: hypothetical protein WC889_07205 [Myxococcota bacterium]|jgi:hypothetical protein
MNKVSVSAAMVAVVLVAAGAARASDDAAGVVRVEFSGKNFRVDSEKEARELLKEGLRDALVLKLLEAGLPRESAVKLRSLAVFTLLDATDKKVDIMEGGAEKTVRVYDVTGRAELVMSQAQLDELAGLLVLMKPSSADELQIYRGFVKGYASLRPPADSLNRVRGNLRDVWSVRIRDAVPAALGQCGTFNSVRVSYAALAEEIAALVAETGDPEIATGLTAQLEGALLRCFQLTIVDEASAESAVVAAQAAGALSKTPGYGRKLQEAAEFKWRTLINDEIQTSPDVDVARLKVEVDGFERVFKGSKLTAELRKKVETYMARSLQSASAPDIVAMVALANEYSDFVRRFPASASLPAVTAHFAAVCARALPGSQAQSDVQYETIGGAWNVCSAASKGKPEFAQITAARPAFAEANRARVERELLGEVAGVLDWITLSGEIRFGAGRETLGSGRLGAAWAKGVQGESCNCTEGTGDICRYFDNGRGRLEVDAKFGAKGLAVIELCSFDLPQSRRALLYKALADRMIPRHDRVEKDRFISGQQCDALEFESKTGGRKAALEGQGGRGSIRFYTGVLPGAVKGETKAVKEERQVHSSRSFDDGACVQWACEVDGCRYEGKVKSKKGGGYLVTVEKAPRTSEIHMNVQKDPDELRACEE